MAKVTFNKLGLKMNQEIKNINFNDQIIEIKQYLSIQEKLKLIGQTIMSAHEEDTNYSNPVKTKVFADLEIIYAYTNIAFTDKQKEDPAKLYDLFYNSGLLNLILNEIPEEEKESIYKGIIDSSKAIYDYQNSVLGLVENLKNLADNNNKELFADLQGIQDAFTSLGEIPMAKDLLTLSLGQQKNIESEDFS